MAAPRNSSPLVGEQDLINTIYDESRNKGDTRRISIEDAMHVAQERLDRSRTVDVPVRRIG